MDTKDKKIINGLTDDQVAHIRIKAKSNPFFLADWVLGYNKLSTSLHAELCRWLIETNNEQYREILLPRSHYKSTVCTITDSIQIALTDDLKNQPYPRNLGPDARILIAHETQESASRFLESITRHFTGNEKLKALFPELRVDPNVQRVNKKELDLPRSKVWSEPTFDTVGVGGKSQGKHFNFIKCDDIYGAAARDSETERKTTVSWVNNLQSLLVTPKSDHIDFIGTRWAFDDIYAHVQKTYGSRLFRYVRSCEELVPVIEDGKIVKRRMPIFPEEFTPESLQILKKDRIVWNAQYANNPAEGSAAFDPNHLRYYNLVGTNRVRTLELKPEEDRIDELDKVILIDPATVGESGFIVTGSNKKNKVYVLEATKKDWKPPELIEYIFLSVMRWKPRIVAIEEVLFSQLFQFWLAREMQVRGIRFKIVPVKTRQKHKETRILGLSNYFTNSQVYFGEGMADLIEEYMQFGAQSVDQMHLLDALSYGPELWRAAIDEKKLDLWKKTEMQLLEGRDPSTGYSTI